MNLMCKINKDMRNSILIFGLIILFKTNTSAQSYNTLWIPDTLTGTNFNLTIKDTFAQIVNTGNQTITGGINGKFWGPTLIINKGDVVNMNVQNNLNDSTTIHWHGMHLPAVMDGGPHQIIPPGTLWQPYWEVKNQASTLWYHPHMHEMSQEQITKGIGGFIIVRDAAEAALALPRKYGVDDIPIAISDRDFNTQNQFSIVPYGDSIMANMTLRAQYSVPAQYVRLRLLNGAIEASYNLGFSDNRSFYVIGTDGGLLDVPVLINGTTPRFLLSAGERVELLVNFSGQSGSSVFLKAYNQSLGNFIPGGEGFPNGPFASFLGHTNYNIVKLNVTNPTVNPITSVPTTLVTNTYPLEQDAALTRTITLSDSTGVTSVPILGPNAFILGHQLFNINTINHSIPLNQTEVWELKSNSIFAHPFHIHDVEFKILTINGVTPPSYQKGWKDVVLVEGGKTVRFIAKFDDYADATHPFMYHCHIALHEDEGMMGQFVVTDINSVNEISKVEIPISLYPNPANDKLFIEFKEQTQSAYYVSIKDFLGRTKMMLPNPYLKDGIDISTLNKGVYSISIMEKSSKQVVTKTFSVY
ncbi:MAG: T9SS C-terminal target domain-containing protein [Crocinitomicaceae bacterium]|nr:T9SS C-terminal target domain-containing protein [Crocinitomicaceae bacterium]